MPKTPNESTKQIDKFRELARELECDEDEEAFDARLRKVGAASKPKVPPKAEEQ